jgi:pectate lyase
MMTMNKKISSLAFLILLNFTSCNKEQNNVQEDSSINESTLIDRAARCTAPGWASQNGGTTGGTGTETTVRTHVQLKAAIQNENVKVIKIMGTINVPEGAAGVIDFADQSGKTIYGTAGAKIIAIDQTRRNSGILYVKRCTNIIFRNIIFEGPGAYDTDGGDLLTIDNCQNVWVDHCEFRDGVDGNLDLKNKSNFITVSYTKFDYLKRPRAGGSGGSNDHRFSNLIGSGDDAVADRGLLKVTFARCWWAKGCVQRMPRVRFGQVHIVNSFFDSPNAKSCVAAEFESNVRVEKNVFERVKNPIHISDRATAVGELGNIFTATTGTRIGKRTAFTPPYSLTIMATAAVKTDVTNKAGATLGGNTCGSF